MSCNDLFTFAKMNETPADPQSNSAAPEKVELQPSPPPIAELVSSYLLALRGIGRTAQVALPHIDKWRKDEGKKIIKKIEKFGISKGNGGSATIGIDSARELAAFTDTIRELREYGSHNPNAVLSKSLFTQLFAEFDSYMGDLLTTIYLKNDKLLKGISREISLSDLMDFDDIKSVKTSMLEKEIETFRRDSYIEQFAALEKKFSIVLRKFKEWPEFVELSQRRNVLMHNGGVVNEQYLIVCAREGHKFSKPVTSGEKLEVEFKYFSAAIRLLSKVGLMLAYTLWAKIFPKEHEELHSSLNDAMYSCLQQKRWLFVAELQDFVLSEPLKKNITEVSFRIRIVNTAIGLKFSGDEKGATALLDSVDWSASYRDFKLAISVLKENYAEATDLMRSIGKSGELLQQSAYHSWPLFTAFRERTEFYDAYAEIYEEPFAEKIETPSGSVEVHATASKPQRTDAQLVSDIKPRDAQSNSASAPKRRQRKAVPPLKKSNQAAAPRSK
jgi:hypothetical protein